MSPSHLGVLSYKVVRFTRGPWLFVFQSSEATEQLHILHDSDFLQGPVPDTNVSSKGRSYEAISSGVFYDLFLTSLSMFECESGMVAIYKAAILQKWQLLSGADEMETIMPLLYRGASFGPSYSHMLRVKIKEIELNYSKRMTRIELSVQKTLERSIVAPSYVRQPHQFLKRMCLIIRPAIENFISRLCNGGRLHSAL